MFIYKNSAPFHYNTSTTESTVQIWDTSQHMPWRGVTNSQSHNIAMQVLIKSNKKNRTNNLCSTRLRFGVYGWKLLYTVSEFKAVTLQKNYWAQLQPMHGAAQSATGLPEGKVLQKLGTEVASSLNIKILTQRWEDGGFLVHQHFQRLSLSFTLLW